MPGFSVIKIIIINKLVTYKIFNTSVSILGVFSVKYPSRSTNWAALRPYCGKVGQIAHSNDTNEAWSGCEELLKSAIWL